MPDYWLSHDVILREISIKFELETKSPLRIGAGKGSILSPLDLPVLTIRIGESNLPYIPGSSLKGVIRSAAESISKSLGLNSCPGGNECNRKYRENLDYYIRSGFPREKIIEDVLSKYCLTCKLFGSASFFSHVLVEDMYPVGIPSRGVKTGIAIERRSGSVRRGALYTVEYVNPGSKFEGNIVMRNTPNYCIGLISMVIDQINNGLIRIGGFKTRGFGKVFLRPIEMSGISVEDGSVVELKELDKLSGLDDLDEKISFEKGNPADLLEKSKEVFLNYARKATSKS